MSEELFRRFLLKSYDAKRYNCGHFVADVWKELTGENIEGFCCSFVSDSNQFLEIIKQREKLREPIPPCVVIMQSGMAIPHAGIVISPDQILHLDENGAKLESLTILKTLFRMKFYR